MSQLHEILAVEGDLKGEKEKIREETINTFSKKEAHFSSQLKRLEMFDESRKQEELEEKTELVTTVGDKLEYMSNSFSNYWDIKLQKEVANQEAKANIEVDGVILVKDAPVTFLLHMEDEIKQLRKVYEEIPTLAPGIDWKKDEVTGIGVWKASNPVIALKTEKTVEYKIIVQPTKEHPAQIEKWTADKPIGRYITEKWSGMLSPAEKSLMLGKLDKVLRAVKKARQRANNQEIKLTNVGRGVFDFINK